MTERNLSEEELSPLMLEYYALMEKIKTFKAKKEETRTKILILLKTNDMTNYDDDHYNLELTSNTRRTFNKEKAIAFIESKNEQAEDYFTISEFETLKIKANEVQ